MYQHVIMVKIVVWAHKRLRREKHVPERKQSSKALTVPFQTCSALLKCAKQINMPGPRPPPNPTQPILPMLLPRPTSHPDLAECQVRGMAQKRVDTKLESRGGGRRAKGRKGCVANEVCKNKGSD